MPKLAHFNHGLFLLLVAAILVGVGRVSARTFATDSFSLSGIITDESGIGLGGVSLSLSDASNATTTTASDGSYSFNDLAGGGSYTLTPVRSSYTFAPQSQTFSNLSANLTANFIGTLSSYEVSGVVTNSNGVGLGGVTVVLSGTRNYVTTTTSAGSYKLTGLPPGASFTVAPTLSGYVFAPPSRSFSNISGNLVANFSAAPQTYSISGKVVTDMSGVSGVPIQLNGTRTATATTAADGSYIFAGLPADGDYVVSASYPGNSFTNYLLTAPTNHSFTHLSANLTANFNAVSLIKPLGIFLGGLAGDLNGDDILDLVITDGAIKVLLGNGDGTFHLSSSQVGTNIFNRLLTTGDFNQDGKLDVAFAIVDNNNSSGNIVIFSGTGDGTLQSGHSYAVGYNPLGLIAGDFNGDGALDLVTSSYDNGDTATSNRNMRMLFGNGDGTFRPAGSYPAGGITSMLAGDFNADGKLDLVITVYINGNGVRLFLNNGDGTFGGGVPVFTDISVIASAAGDFNGDGKLDLALSSGILGSDQVNVVLGNGNGTFQPPLQNAAGTHDTQDSIKVGDLNGDGKPDLLVAVAQGEINLLVGRGDGTFARGVNLISSVNRDYQPTVVGDFNHDGKLDFAYGVYSSTRGAIVVMLNNPALPSAPTNSLTGRLVDDSNKPLSGVPVVLSGGQSGSVITDTNGNYSFTNIVGGRTVTITPVKALYNFTPTSQAVTVDGDKSGLDFLGVKQRFSLTGRITERGNGLSNVAVILSSSTPGSTPLTTITDSIGDYSFTGITAGSVYTLTPVRTNYGFNPSSQSVLLSGDRAALNFTALSLPVAVQFSLTGYGVNESDGHAVITVTRTGNTSGTVSVDYRTADTDTFTVGCADTVNNNGGAYGRCDFATVVSTLNFAAGETSKNITVPIIDDAFVEGAETFQVQLSNAVGASLGTPATATVTIQDNDQAGQANPIFSSPFFVRQQYLDFLSREPDAGGFNAYLNLLNNCPDVNNVDPNAPSAACDRITVSAAFFGSQEFKLKGFFVFRFYRVAFNRLPQYAEIVPDMSAVTGRTGSEVFTKKASFTDAFARRPEFINAYGTMTNGQYVAALLGRYNLSQITTPDPAQPDGTVLVTLTANDLTSALNSNMLTRGQVLRALADSNEVVNVKVVAADMLSATEYERAFVGMQYYGYLRRTPDAPGFKAWLTYLTTHPDDFRTMVNGFMNSQEYRIRFGTANQ
ncbi:MAG: FG-GAP-like repeat-containing protein [Pyrinomonadaceae bacterium]